MKVSGLDRFAEKMKKMGNDKEKSNCGWRCRCSGGIGFWGFGSALAMILSYAKNSSIMWAILHGIISWFYVIYRIIVDYHLFG